MKVLRVELTPLDSVWVRLRYWLEPSHPEKREIKLDDIQLLIDQGELYYYTSRPDLALVGQRLFRWLDGDGRWLSRMMQSCSPPGLLLAISAEGRLAHLPWEVLHDIKGFIIEREGTPVIPVRWMSSCPPARSVVRKRALSLLFMATASEEVNPVLDFEGEEADILKFTADLPLTLRVEESGSINQLAALWRRYPVDYFDVFHLTGHASTQEGQPVFMTETETGELYPATSSELLNAFSGRLPQLVFLSGCRTAQASEEGTVSSMAENLVKSGLPAVLGWGRPVLDETASAAAAKFYQKLAEGFSIAEALNFTYRYLREVGAHDWHLLRLHLRQDAWGALVEPPGDYLPPIETLQDQFLDSEGHVRVANPAQFVGRRRLLQKSLRSFKDSHGILFYGLGGNGKSTLAARLLERMPEYTAIVFYQLFDEVELSSELLQQCKSALGYEILSKEVLPFMQRLSLFLEQGLNSPSNLFCFVLDDFEANLESDVAGKRVLKTEAVTAVNSLLNAIRKSGKQHRVIITSRYQVDFSKSTSRTRIKQLSVPALNSTDLEKKYSRLTSFQLNSSISSELQQRAKNSADGNPRLLEWLDLILQDSSTDQSYIISKMAAEEVRFRESILAEELLNQQSEQLRELLRKTIAFNIPIPEIILLEVAKDIDGYEQQKLRAISLGLLEVSQQKEQQKFRVPKVLFPLLFDSQEINIQNWLLEAAANAVYEIWWLPKNVSIDEEQAQEIYRLTNLAKQEERAIRVGEALVNHFGGKESYRKAICLAEDNILLQKGLLGDRHPVVVQGISDVARLYYNQGMYAQAEPLLLDVLTIRHTTLGQEHPDVAMSLSNLAALYDKTGRYEEAENLFREVIEINRQLLGDENANLAMSLNNLAMLLYNRGRYVESEPLLEESFTMWKALLGNSHPNVAMSLNNLAVLYEKQGHYGKTEELYREILRIYRRQSEKNSSNIARTLNNLAMSYYNQGLYDDAADFAEQALEMWRSLLGDEHPDIAMAISNLATIYSSQGRHSEVEELYCQALNMNRKLLGEHPNVALGLSNLAMYYYTQSQYDKAEVLLEESLKLNRKLLGEDHPGLFLPLNNMAMVQKSQSRYVDAKSTLERSLELAVESLGEDHPDIAMSLNNLAGVYQNQEKYGEAEALYRDALELNKRILGEIHPFTVTIIKNLADLYETLERYEEAEALYEDALSVYERTVGCKDAGAIATLSNLAYLSTKKEAYEKAELLAERTIKLTRNVLGEQHPDVAMELNGLAFIYYKQGRYTEAEALYKESLSLRRQLFGDKNNQVAYVLERLADVLFAKGHSEEASSFLQEAISINRELLEEGSIDLANCIFNKALTYYHQQQYEESEALYREVIQMESVLNESHSIAAFAADSLGSICSIQNRDSEADELHREAIILYKKIGDSHRLQLANSLSHLGNSYFKQTRFGEAQQSYAESLDVYRENLDEESPELANCVVSLGQAYHQQQRFDKAEALYREAIEMESVVDENPTTVVRAFDLLGSICSIQNRNSEANKLYRKAIALYRTIGDSHRLPLANSLGYLANSYRRQKRFDEAKRSYTESLSIYKELLDETSPELLNCTLNIAAVYYQQGYYVEAEPLYRGIIEIKSLIDEEPAIVALAFESLGHIRSIQERHGEADNFYREAIKLRQGIDQGSSLQLACSLNYLAGSCFKQNRLEESETLYRQSLALCNQDPGEAIALAGEENTPLGASLSGIARSCHAQNNYKEAESFYRRAIDVLREVFGEEHQSTQNVKGKLQELLERPDKSI